MVGIVMMFYKEKKNRKIKSFRIPKLSVSKLILFDSNFRQMKQSKENADYGYSNTTISSIFLSYRTSITHFTFLLN